MAITTRSARFLDGPASEDRRVGPGAYDISGAGLTGSKLRPSFAGFLTSKKRELRFTTGTVAETPGPGSYLHKGMPQGVYLKQEVAKALHMPINHAFGSHSKREFIHVDEPGKNQNHSGSASGLSITATSAQGNNNNGSQHNRPRRRARSSPSSSLGLMPPAYHPPSIPHRDVTFGFDQDKEGRVKPIKNPKAVVTGVGNDTVGPAFYHPEATLPSTACSALFSRSSAKRSPWLIQHPELPGPGAYHTEEPITANHRQPILGGYGCNGSVASGQPAKGTAAFESRTRRKSFAELGTETGIEVGPGRYKLTNVDAALKPRTRLPAFLCTSPRGEATFKSNKNPGPGAYSSMQSLSGFGQKPALRLTDEATGFGSATRPCMSKTVDPNNTPGPASYEHEQQCSISVSAKKTAARRIRGGFGSATARFYRPDMSSRDAFVDDIYNPLPPEFFEDAKDTTRVQQLKRPGVLVRDHSRRLATVPGKIRDAFLQVSTNANVDIPGVGSYDIEKPLVAEDPQARSRLLIRRGTNASQSLSGSVEAPSSHWCKAKRFEDNVFSGQKISDTPGPGTYASEVKKTQGHASRSINTTGGMSKDLRFRYPEYLPPKVQESWLCNHPGPAAYETGSSMVKKTFNITYKGKADGTKPVKGVVHGHHHAATQQQPRQQQPRQQTPQKVFRTVEPRSNTRMEVAPTSGIPDSARMGFEEYSLVTKTTGAIGAHGVLMVVAWIFLSQAAEVIAHWVQNKTNLRTNFFQVYENGHRLLNAHRILNVTAFLMGLVAMIIILTTKAFRVAVSRQERHLLYGFALMFVMFCQILFRIMYPNQEKFKCTHRWMGMLVNFWAFFCAITGYELTAAGGNDGTNNGSTGGEGQIAIFVAWAVLKVGIWLYYVVMRRLGKAKSYGDARAEFKGSQLPVLTSS